MCDAPELRWIKRNAERVLQYKKTEIEVLPDRASGIGARESGFIQFTKWVDVPEDADVDEGEWAIPPPASALSGPIPPSAALRLHHECVAFLRPLIEACANTPEGRLALKAWDEATGYAAYEKANIR